GCARERKQEQRPQRSRQQITRGLPFRQQRTSERIDFHHSFLQQRTLAGLGGILLFSGSRCHLPYRLLVPIQAIASISTRISGVARLLTSTNVEHGKSPLKNSCRARHTAVLFLMFTT